MRACCDLPCAQAANTQSQSDSVRRAARVHRATRVQRLARVKRNCVRVRAVVAGDDLGELEGLP